MAREDAKTFESDGPLTISNSFVSNNRVSNSHVSNSHVNNNNSNNFI